jgi:hypothetical protein
MTPGLLLSLGADGGMIGRKSFQDQGRKATAFLPCDQAWQSQYSLFPGEYQWAQVGLAQRNPTWSRVA